MDILFPNPESGFVRSMFAKKANKCNIFKFFIEKQQNKLKLVVLPQVLQKKTNAMQKDDTIDLSDGENKININEISHDTNESNIKKSYKVKMFQVDNNHKT